MTPPHRAPFPSSPFLTPTEVASYLKVSRMTISRLVNKKELPAIRVGRSVRIRNVDFREYLDRNTVQ